MTYRDDNCINKMAATCKGWLPIGIRPLLQEMLRHCNYRPSNICSQAMSFMINSDSICPIYLEFDISKLTYILIYYALCVADLHWDFFN